MSKAETRSSCWMVEVGDESMQVHEGRFAADKNAPVRIINLTPHPVTVDPGGSNPVTFPPTGVVARVREVLRGRHCLTVTDGRIPLQWISYGDEVDGLAAPRDGVFYLVSRVTAAAIHRADLVFPQDEVRDNSGQIIGCLALGSFTAGKTRGA